jgi:hypothetical protein
MDVEWIILADGAQVMGNKLYVLGGGWDVLRVNSEFPIQQQVSLAVSFSVPWDETNMKHNFEIAIMHEDDNREIAKVGGQFEVGRPAGIPVGSTQRSQMAVTLPLAIQKPGTHVISTRLEGTEKRRTTFRVMGGKPIPMPA